MYIQLTNVVQYKRTNPYISTMDRRAWVCFSLLYDEEEYMYAKKFKYYTWILDVTVHNNGVVYLYISDRSSSSVISYTFISYIHIKTNTFIMFYVFNLFILAIASLTLLLIWIDYTYFENNYILWIGSKLFQHFKYIIES